jgi:hypothetical protein
MAEEEDASSPSRAKVLKAATSLASSTVTKIGSPTLISAVHSAFKIF